MADRLEIDSIDREGRMIVIRFRPNARLDGLHLVKVASGWPGATLVPPVSVTLDLEAAPEPSAEARRVGPRRGDNSRGRSPSTQGSWWTARALAGEVKAGFNKAEVLRVPERNPRDEDGLFSRLLSLLQALDAG
jgi:hypothetical protein